MQHLLIGVNHMADHHELFSWSIKTHLESEFKTKLSDVTEKLQEISSTNKKLRKDLDFQLGRVKHAKVYLEFIRKLSISFFVLFWLHFKADWNKRVAQFDQAEAVYEKYIDGKNNDPNFKYDIKEEDKLRGAVGDKKALVDRAESEHDQQVQAFNALQTQIYTIDLPALCRKLFKLFWASKQQKRFQKKFLKLTICLNKKRSQKEIHVFLTDLWITATTELSQKSQIRLRSDLEVFYC